MPVSRRGFLRILDTERSGPMSGAFLAARGLEAYFADTQRGRATRPPLPPGVEEIRISSNENPLGPGKAALDAIVGKFPEAGRYPFNSTPSEGKLVEAIAANKVKPENVVLGAGSQEILKSAVRAFTSPYRGAGHRGADVRELHAAARSGSTSGHRGQGRLGDAVSTSSR